MSSRNSQLVCQYHENISRTMIEEFVRGQMASRETQRNTLHFCTYCVSVAVIQSGIAAVLV
jgi:hypothetical protein